MASSLMISGYALVGIVRLRRVHHRFAVKEKCIPYVSKKNSTNVLSSNRDGKEPVLLDIDSSSAEILRYWGAFFTAELSRSLASKLVN